MKIDCLSVYFCLQCDTYTNRALFLFKDACVLWHGTPVLHHPAGIFCAFCSVLVVDACEHTFLSLPPHFGQLLVVCAGCFCLHLYDSMKINTDVPNDFILLFPGCDRAAQQLPPHQRLPGCHLLLSHSELAYVKLAFFLDNKNFDVKDASSRHTATVSCYGGVFVCRKNLRLRPGGNFEFMAG
jgi:hypothetical protein